MGKDDGKTLPMWRGKVDVAFFEGIAGKSAREECSQGGCAKSERIVAL
jgi:hypothetical protein